MNVFLYYRTWVNADLVKQICGDSVECIYDYSTTLSQEFAMYSKFYQDQFRNIYENVLRPEARVISCGALPTPGNGRKSTFQFTPGTMVKFDCDEGYQLIGERRRWCYDTGDWNWAEKGDAECIPQGAYNARRAGITAAIVVAVLIPVGICGFCLILKLREKAAEKAEMRYHYPQNSGVPNSNTYDTYQNPNDRRTYSNSNLNIK